MLTQELTAEQRKHINKLVNDLWKLHDQALKEHKTDEAFQYSAQAFQLLGSLPENTIYLQTEQ